MRTLGFLFFLTLCSAQVPEFRTTAQDRTGLSVTIYQNGLAAIRDTRRVNLSAGSSRLAFADLIPTLRPKSATLIDPGRGVKVRERNYEFNLLSPASLVDASLGQPVRIKGEEGTADVAGLLLSVPLLHPSMRANAKPLERIARLRSAYTQPPDPDVMVATLEGQRSAKPGNLGFIEIPSQLRASPTLLQDLTTDVPGLRDLTLLYSATDFTWSANYVATLDSDGKHLDLKVFATVTNTSGSDLPGAMLQLMAGEPNIVYDPPPPDPSAPRLDCTTVEVMASASRPPTFKEEKISEYPLFTLDRPVTLARNSTKQLSLMGMKHIPIIKVFLAESPYEDFGLSPSSFLASPLFEIEPQAPGYSPIPLRWRMNLPETDAPTEIPPSAEAQWNLSQWLACHHPPVLITGALMNTKASNLGRALPKGSLLLQYLDPSGALLMLPAIGYLGSEFPQTPPGEEIDLTFGPARGLGVNRHGTYRKVIPVEPIKDEEGRVHSQRRFEYGVQVQIISDLPSATEVTVREPLTEGWKLLSATHPGLQSGADAYDFRVSVPAHGCTTLHYAVRTAPEAWTPE